MYCDKCIKVLLSEFIVAHVLIPRLRKSTEKYSAKKLIRKLLDLFEEMVDYLGQNLATERTTSLLSKIIDSQELHCLIRKLPGDLH